MSRPVRSPSDVLPPPDLAGLRATLDGIDDALHDLLMRRADLVAQSQALRAKSGVALRPGREAAILRRLLGRNRGALRPVTVLRIVREVLNGSSAQQGALRVVAPAGLRSIVAGHFGEVACKVADDPAAVVASVAEGSASVAVLPWPGDWWPLLLRAAGAVHVVARLPFWGAAEAEALVLTGTPPDPSGDDRTLVAGLGGSAALAAALVAEGAAVIERMDVAGCGLVEVAAFMGAERLPAGAAIVGAYPVPLGACA